MSKAERPNVDEPVIVQGRDLLSDSFLGNQTVLDAVDHPLSVTDDDDSVDFSEEELAELALSYDPPKDSESILGGVNFSRDDEPTMSGSLLKMLRTLLVVTIAVVIVAVLVISQIPW